jgi:hypothetical protein
MGQQQRPKSAGWFLFPGSQSTRQNQSPTKRDDQQITCFFFFFFFVFFIYLSLAAYVLHPVVVF